MLFLLIVNKMEDVLEVHAGEDQDLTRDGGSRMDHTILIPGCGNKYSCRQTLKRHLTEKHTATRTPWQCPDCRYLAVRKYDLKNHCATKHSAMESCALDQKEMYQPEKKKDEETKKEAEERKKEDAGKGKAEIERRKKSEKGKKKKEEDKKKRETGGKREERGGMKGERGPKETF